MRPEDASSSSRSPNWPRDMAVSVRPGQEVFPEEFRRRHDPVECLADGGVFRDSSPPLRSLQLVDDPELHRAVLARTRALRAMIIASFLRRNASGCVSEIGRHRWLRTTITGLRGRRESRSSSGVRSKRPPVRTRRCPLWRGQVRIAGRGRYSRSGGSSLRPPETPNPYLPEAAVFSHQGTLAGRTALPFFQIERDATTA